MARKSQKNVVIAENIPSVVLDHVSQIDSWESDTTLDTLFLEEVVQEVQADEATEVRVSEADAFEPDFDQLAISFPDDLVIEKAQDTADEIDWRMSAEAADHPDNASIQKNLEKARSAIVNKAAARVMLMANVPASFLNREVHSGARYNVYAIGKFADIAKALTDSTRVKNAINEAIITSLFRCATAGVPFDMELAKACASAQYPVKTEGARKHLKRHTVSTTTAPTQAGSTMQALVTLGIVSATGTKNPTYVVQDNAVTNKLRELMSA